MISNGQHPRGDQHETPLISASRDVESLAAFADAAMHEVAAHLKPPTTGRVLEVSAAMAMLDCNCRTGAIRVRGDF